MHGLLSHGVVRRGSPGCFSATVGLISIVSISGCWVTPVDLDSMACPCPGGWECGPDRTCVPPGHDNGKGPDDGVLDASVDASGPDAAAPDTGTDKLCEGLTETTPSSSRMASGEIIHFQNFATDYRCSPSGKYRFGFDSEGNLELRSGVAVLWSQPTSRTRDGAVILPHRVIMQADSNLVAREMDPPPSDPPVKLPALWASGTSAGSAANPSSELNSVLTVQDAGHVVITAPSGKVLWSKP